MTQVYQTDLISTEVDTYRNCNSTCTETKCTESDM